MTELNWTQRNCSECQAKIRATDKFCRQCGIKQEWQEWQECRQWEQWQVSQQWQLSQDQAARPTASVRLKTGPRSDAVTNNVAEAQVINSGYETKSLFRPVSGPLLKAVADGMAIEQALSGYSKVVRNIVLALMSVPVWLMIILLSPLDAWTATRAMRVLPQLIAARQPGL